MSSNDRETTFAEFAVGFVVVGAVGAAVVGAAIAAGTAAPVVATG